MPVLPDLGVCSSSNDPGGWVHDLWEVAGVRSGSSVLPFA